ncbi:MAG TPA: adenylosuccinate synthase [Candidatus Thermoplasmatota archaeon]|nr:adenylosuccinate synthase [Candidatus Thermoplasmatota archaeon]
MPAHAILGAQWGDEGKGKLVDVLAPGYDFVVRFQGGNNAGHTVVVGKETYKFHLLPSGAVQGRRVVIGNGVVVDPRVLVQELDQLEGRGKKVRLLISDRAHVILPYHVSLDGAAEQGKGGGRKIGTTRRGIGPCYADKAARLGVRMMELVDPARFEARLREVYPLKEREMRMWEVPDAPSLESILKDYTPLGARLQRYVADAGEALGAALKGKKRVLLEGAQGLLLDIDHGTYPYVTSSSTVGAAGGSGMGAHHVEGVLGVAKAYATRVGEGPFPTELSSAEGVGKRLLEVGKEFGTTTGRPRRVGWLDLPAMRYTIRVGGITHLALTKLDVLAGLERVEVAVAYQTPKGTLRSFPSDEARLLGARPRYTSVPGWTETAKRVGKGWALSKEAAAYVRFVEKELGIPVVMASVGPARDATITLRRHPFGRA